MKAIRSEFYAIEQKYNDFFKRQIPCLLISGEGTNKAN